MTHKATPSFLADYRASLTQAGFAAAEIDLVVQIREKLAAHEKHGTVAVNAAGAGEGEIIIYGPIGFDWSGDGLTPKLLLEQLAALGPGLKKLTVRIDSEGGSVFDGYAIYNILRRQEAPITVVVDGLAASAASFIAQAAAPGELLANEASMFMAHRSSGIVMGNSKDMLHMAAVLEKLDGQIADIYAARSKRKAATWLELMDKETWLTGKEAVAAKLADRVVAADEKAQARAAQNAVAEQAQLEEEAAVKAEAERVAVRLRLLELDDLTAPAAVP